MHTASPTRTVAEIIKAEWKAVRKESCISKSMVLVRASRDPTKSNTPANNSASANHPSDGKASMIDTVRADRTKGNTAHHAYRPRVIEPQLRSLHIKSRKGTKLQSANIPAGSPQR